MMTELVESRRISDKTKIFTQKANEASKRLATESNELGRRANAARGRSARKTNREEKSERFFDKAFGKRSRSRTRSSLEDVNGVDTMPSALVCSLS